eukprot:CFRG4203T1
MERVIKLTKRLVLPIPGNVYAHAVCLGDVDNDGENECVVGCLSGHLCIFRHLQTNPWRKCSGLGTITCVTVAEINNTIGENSLVCVNAEGELHLFNLSNSNVHLYSDTESDDTLDDLNRAFPLEGEGEKDQGITSEAVHKTHTLSHSFAQTHRPIHGKTEYPSKEAIFDSITRTNATIKSSKMKLTEDTTEDTLTLHPTCVYDVPVNVSCVVVGDIDNDGLNELVVGTTDRVVISYRLEGSELLKLKRWEVRGQITTLTITPDAHGRNVLIVGQQESGYIVIEKGERMRQFEPPLDKVVDVMDVATTCRLSCDVLGGVRFDPTNLSNTFLAVGSSDGTIQLLMDERCMWTLRMPRVFSIAKLQLSAKCSEMPKRVAENVVGVAYDGTTYIADKDHMVVFHVQQQVVAFTAGMFTPYAGSTCAPSLVYVGMDSCLYLYYDLGMTSLEVPSLTQMATADIQKIQDELKVTLTKEDTRALLKMCLYDFDNTDSNRYTDEAILQKLQCAGLADTLLQEGHSA